MVFDNRTDAGRRLGERLGSLRDEDAVVLGLPRGGVVVAAEVARRLHKPLDIAVVRKLGVPFQPEVGMGAIGEDGVRVVNDEVVRRAGVSDEQLAGVEEQERTELERRARAYRGDRQRPEVRGRTVVVVDDGIATGSTARAACRSARDRGAARVVLAVPVAPRDAELRLRQDIDELVSVETPADFMAIGQFYTDFAQTTDEEVLACLAAGGEEQAGSTEGAGAGPGDGEVEVSAGGVELGGELVVPEDATAVVVFVHGSGSSRHSPRNRYVAALLNEAGLGTLLFDLLTEEEAQDRANVFDTALLAERLAQVTRGLRAEPAVEGLPVGYFGASTGAAAALWAAADPAAGIGAVVSRGGRPDLAGDRLRDVITPALLIVGEEDELVLELNRRAQEALHGPNELAVVEGATHLFEEPGALDEVAGLARDWFSRYLTAAPHGA
ncbi:phosphoribosyltransferase family protein [Streptomyces sp. ACA25]|uniref:phosphoribosyltransferase family protein n=1 Tax=Streptomyces sp. ACA25 TaxID=3022596 RepID=UPI0023078D4B|nr:phosphoribosyltransferase family protein [Streptomyces sp. ACA25]MDB1087586.1 phosphoribosyltransferase family protein [Streptomyces sp. ACA25]